MSSGTLFMNLFSLTEPFGPPSPEAPLSEMPRRSACCRARRCSRGSRSAGRSRGRCSSSSRRTPRPCGSAGSSRPRTASPRDARCRAGVCGLPSTLFTPASGLICGQLGVLREDPELLLLGEDRLPDLLVALSKTPLYLSAHSFGEWCGAWFAPGQKYMKNGLSGATCFASAIIPIARSTRSLDRW